MSYTEQQIQQVWTKAQFVDHTNELNGFRKDSYGAWIYRWHYANRQSEYGWEVDHGVPRSRNGTGDLLNLRPLHWANNAAKGDCMFFMPAVTSSGNQNLWLRPEFRPVYETDLATLARLLYERSLRPPSSRFRTLPQLIDELMSGLAR
jgi:hypothetical protein